MEELRNCLMYTALELENTKSAFQEELRKRDDQLDHLKGLLIKSFRERDEAEETCRRLLSETLLLRQQSQTAPLSGVSTIEDEPERGIDSNNAFLSSEESSVSSPATDPIAGKARGFGELVPEKPLPEKGRLLQAVMEAGPLLQTLLLAGPLPQWEHRPLPPQALDIPPVTIPSPPPELLSRNSMALVDGSYL